MGVIGAVLGGSLLGVGMASLQGRGRTEPDPAAPAAAAMDGPPRPPTAPETPAADEDGGLPAAEREKERRRLALGQRRSREVFTSGLGAAGLADAAGKTLLGG